MCLLVVPRIIFPSLTIIGDDHLINLILQQANGGRISFIQDRESEGGQGQSPMLAFINAHHEYIIFDPFNNRKCLISRKTLETNSSLEKSGNYLFPEVANPNDDCLYQVVIFNCCYFYLLSQQTLDMHQYMGSFLNLIWRKIKFLQFHTCHQKDLGKPYSVDLPTNCLPWQSYAHHFLNPCWKRDLAYPWNDFDLSESLGWLQVRRITPSIRITWWIKDRSDPWDLAVILKFL